MSNRKQSVILFSLVALVAIMISACERPYSNVPLETPAAEETSLFVSPFPTSDNPMAMVEELSTGTALAETAAALTAGTPPAVEATESEAPASGDGNDTSDQPVATTAVPASNNPTATNTQSLPNVPSNKPGSYTLQHGEFPYCIARRFNVDPAELLSLNGLANGDVYYPNLTLTIPQSGRPFPGIRALHSHPADSKII